MRTMPVPAGHHRSRYALVALAFFLGSCMTEPSVALPEGAEAFTPPQQYVQWWGATESCSELQGNMARVEWYVVPGAATFPTDQGEKVGIRIRTGDRIRIVVAGQYQMLELVVRHEMLHALLDAPGHPDEYFTSRCRLTWESWGVDPQQAVADLS